MSTKAVTPAPTAPAKSPMAGTTAAPSTTKRPTRVSKVDPNETPEAAFKRLAVPRTVKALKALKQLQNLARFKPTDEQRNKVFTTIQSALKTAHDSWTGQTVQAEGFSL